MNTELLLKVKQHILEEPRRLDMYRWLEHHKPGELLWDSAYDGPEDDQVSVPDCGTVGCIAGWIVSLGGAEHLTETRLLSNLASELLGLSRDIVDQLFYTNNWFLWATNGNSLKSQYDNSAPGSRQRAEVVARVIDLWLEWRNTHETHRSNQRKRLWAGVSGDAYAED